MKITDIVIENFMSIKKIEFSLDKPGLNLILGNNVDNKCYDSNGSAKSALFEAVTWCLYGKLLRNETTINDVVRNGQSTMEVTVRLDPEDGSSPVLISRHRMKTKSIVSASTLDGTPLFPADSSTDIQQYIDKWLGLDFKAFTNSVFFGKGLTKFFMSASDEERKDLLDTILQTISFDTILTKVKESLSETKSIIETSDAKLSVYNNLREEKEKQFMIVKNSSESLITGSKEEIKALQVQLNMAESMRKEEEKRTPSLREEADGLVQEHTNKQTEAKKDYSEKLLALDEEYKKKMTFLIVNKDALLDRVTIARRSRSNSLQEAKKKLDELSLQVDEETKSFLKKEAELNHQIRNNASLVSKIRKQEGMTTCQECDMAIPDEHYEQRLHRALTEEKELQALKHRFQTELKEFNEGIVATQLNLLRAIKEKEKEDQDWYSAAVLNIEKEFSKEQLNLKQDQASEQRELHAAYTQISQAIHAEYNNKVADAKQRFSDNILEISKLNSIISQIQAKIQEKKMLISNCEQNARNIQGELDSINQNVIGLKTKLKQAYDYKDKLEFWNEGFGPKGIRSFILESSLPFLTERANYYSLFLTGGTIKINISPITILKSGEAREKLSVTAENMYGSKVYYGNSDGERRRIDVCILLAIQDLVKSYSTREWNTLIFDEVFDTLDGAGIEHLIELLRSLEDKSIFLITHSSHIKKYFDTAFVITKRDGVSSLEKNKVGQKLSE